MKDIPMFVTENGAASLILREIPYREEAFVHLRASQNPEALLEECRSFCRACGAEWIFAAGEGIPASFPLHMTLLEMRGIAQPEEAMIDRLFPVTEATVTQWRTLYNEKMRRTDHAATLLQRDEAEILSSGGAYFVHQNGHPIGLGWLRDGRLEAIAALEPGMGLRTAHTLLSLIPGMSITLEVTSTNLPALRLYEALGFLPVREVRRWHRLWPLS